MGAGSSAAPEKLPSPAGPVAMPQFYVRRGPCRREMAVASPPAVGLLYDERMCAHATPDREEHPENPERLRTIWRKLNAEGITSRCVVLKAKEAEDKYIASVHSQDHIKLMKEISSKKYDSSRSTIASKYNSIYFNKGSSESAVLAAGSVIEVAEKVAAGDLSSAIALVRPPGHHAEHDEAMGFCLFNNVAVAASYLLNERPDLGIKKILIVDWDVHHGNATQKMFYSDPRVLSFSVHRFDRGNFYPYKADASYCFIGEGPGKGYNINVPWDQVKCGDADYLAAWDHILFPVTEAFGPDIILVSAGFDAALGDPLGGCCVTPDGYALLLTKLLGFAQGRTVMALEGGYNLRSTADSVFACAKVLLGDKFTLNVLEKQPFKSTWRVIRAVRNALKTCWPVLSGKLQENVSPRDVHFSLSSPLCPVPQETQAISKWGRDTSAPATSTIKSVPLRVRATDKGEEPCMSYRTHHVEGFGESKRRRLGDEVLKVEVKGDILDDYDVGTDSVISNKESVISNKESLPLLQFPNGTCTVGKGTSGKDELDHEKPEQKDEQGGSRDQVPSSPRPAPVMAASKVAESQGHLNKLRATSGQEDTTAGQGQPSSSRATCGQDSGGLGFDGLTLEDFKLRPEVRDAFAPAAPQLQNTELASPEHLAAQLEAAAWKVWVLLRQDRNEVGPDPTPRRGSVARPDLSLLTSKRNLRKVWEACKGFRKNAWERVGRKYTLRWIACRRKLLKSGAHARRSRGRGGYP